MLKKHEINVVRCKYMNTNYIKKLNIFIRKLIIKFIIKKLSDNKIE